MSLQIFRRDISDLFICRIFFRSTALAMRSFFSAYHTNSNKYNDRNAGNSHTRGKSRHMINKPYLMLPR